MSDRADEQATAAPDVLDEVDRAIGTLQSHPDADVRDAAARLLEGIDAVHRAGLTHLVHAIHAMGGDAFLNRLIADPAIRMLLMSYNLIAVDRRLQAEEALDTVRGHLHAHGVDVEITEVVGGVVYVHVHGLSRTGLAVDAIRRDIEAALRTELLGFQELVFRDRGAEPPSQFIALDGLKRVNRPVYYDALAADELAEGASRAVEVHGVPVLFVRVHGDVYAVRNRCGDSPLPLAFSVLNGFELRCSWHGCRYDVRTGRRLDTDAPRLHVFPVAETDGRVRAALDVMPGCEER